MNTARENLAGAARKMADLEVGALSICGTPRRHGGAGRRGPLQAVSEP
ncbi:hypothetical protein [Dactylosporangium salmoneum]|uniref:Uncharacterized protein n=1 Tax=Dactylosporangium salmoneum TaxID=53361 RepID=A0ABN3I9D3_9ACTN